MRGEAVELIARSLAKQCYDDGEVLQRDCREPAAQLSTRGEARTAQQDRLVPLQALADPCRARADEAG